MSSSTCANVPFLARGFVNGVSEFALPEGWRLLLSQLAGHDCERPGAPSGIAKRMTSPERIRATLQGSRSAREQRLVERIPDIPDTAYITDGQVAVPSSFGTAHFRGVGHISTSGRESFGITNIARTDEGYASATAGEASRAATAGGVSRRYHSASSAAWQPEPAAVIAWR